jgi:hypothetical protein
VVHPEHQSTGKVFEIASVTGPWVCERRMVVLMCATKPQRAWLVDSVAAIAGMYGDVRQHELGERRYIVAHTAD